MLELIPLCEGDFSPSLFLCTKRFHEHTVRWWPSASQEESYQDLNLPEPSSWTSQPQELGEVMSII